MGESTYSSDAPRALHRRHVGCASRRREYCRLAQREHYQDADRLFPRDAYRNMFDWLRERHGDRLACKLTVELLALAHERGCEAELAGLLEAHLQAATLPDLAELHARFCADPTRLPQVSVKLTPLSAYEALLVPVASVLSSLMLSSAIGLSLLEKGYRVLFMRTSDLVQKLQVARRELALEAAINRLDRFDLLILDDITYVTKDQAETSVLFELVSARYERRSLLITANQPFGEWGKIFPDPAMTLAAVDRLVHHATIFEMNVESYRRRAAQRRAGPGRPPTRATIKTSEQSSPSDNQNSA